MTDEAKIDEEIREMNAELAEAAHLGVEEEFDRREAEYDKEQEAAE